MAVQLGLYDNFAGSLILDASSRASQLVIVDGEHGFGTLTCFVKMALWEAFMLYDRPGLPHVQLTEYGLPVWQGRLEDVDIVQGGVNLTALGYWRALSDAPYTALWSTTSVSDWRPITSLDIAGYVPTLYSTDTNNRLFIGMTKNTLYGNGTDIGGLALFDLSGGQRLINYISYDYSYNLPANWEARLAAFDSSWGNIATSILTSTGGTASGSATWDLSAFPRAILTMQIFNNTGGNYTNVGNETGATFFRLTNIRVTSGGASLGASEIAKDLVAYINGINPAQLAASTALVGVPGNQLSDEVYQDAYPADILDRLAKLGDNSTPVALFETGVWEGKLLTFQKRGTTARTWYVDVSTLELQRTINALYNSVYATYQEAGGRTLRTAINPDAASIARYGVTRRQAVNASTTIVAQANAQRNAALQDGKDPQPRITITFDRVYDGAGSVYPLWMVRAWDTMVLRNLPATLSTQLDRIRQFRIIEKSYDVDANALTVTPEQYIPSLDVLTARLAAGINPRPTVFGGRGNYD